MLRRSLLLLLSTLALLLSSCDSYRAKQTVALADFFYKSSQPST